jgi:hypothetical protein
MPDLGKHPACKLISLISFRFFGLIHSGKWIPGEGSLVINESFGYTNSGECREERRFFAIFQLVICVLHLDTNKDAICYKTLFNQKDVERIKKSF